MTDPADPHPAPTQPDHVSDRILDSGPSPGAEPEASWDRHRELLALLLAVAATGRILQAMLSAYGYAKPAPGSGQGIAWSIFLPALSAGGDVITALLVVAALAAAVGSGRRAPGRLGWLTIQGVSVVGVVSAALAVLAIEEYQRNRADASSAGPSGFGGGPAYGWLQAGLVAHMLPSAALAGTAAYVAWRRIAAAVTDEVDGADEVRAPKPA